MDNSIYIETIKKFGLAEYEAKCYLALFDKESLAISEIASLAGVPRSNIYAVMQKLLARGLCTAIPGKVKKYAATDPAFFKKEMLESLTETRKAVDELSEKLDSLHKTNKTNNNRLEYIEILKSSYQIHRKFVELFTRAEKEVLIFCKPPFSYNSAKEQKEQFRAQVDATERGVVVRGIIELPPEDQIEDFFKGHFGKPNSNEGDEVRVINELPIKLNIFDNKICLFTLEDPIKEETSLTMLVTEHEAMAKTHRLLFESIWEKAINYYVANGEKIYLSPYADKNNGGPFKN